ncbi:hypothetical protein ITQ94_08980 [Pediococcus pentosaceus]|uniref:hypothetical protein n=1 Tax=Pediococcus pentosaceus TaxID=1255 RepID=UPI0018FEA8EF|nr:hypothetical protein [Pediococcus pentosaceus]MBF7131569.1 hypothetical protein [Pediococcus pentosaceus]
MVGKIITVLLATMLVVAVVYGWISLIAFLLCAGFSTMGLTLPIGGMRLIVLAITLLIGVSVPKSK